jgi:hypothetical protein
MLVVTNHNNYNWLQEQQKVRSGRIRARQLQARSVPGVA